MGRKPHFSVDTCNKLIFYKYQIVIPLKVVICDIFAYKHAAINGQIVFIKASVQYKPILETLQSSSLIYLNSFW